MVEKELWTEAMLRVLSSEAPVICIPGWGHKQNFGAGNIIKINHRKREERKHSIRGAPFANGLEGSCQYDARKEFRNKRTIVEGLSLERLVGPDGLMVLLSLLAAGDLPKAQIIELTKRLHIPGYELSCNLSGATAQIALTAYLGEGFYLQSELEELIARAIEQYAEPSSNFRSL